MIDDFQKNDNLEMFNYYNKTLKKNVLSFQKRESSQSSSVRSKIKNSLTIFQNKKSLKETIEPLQRKIYLKKIKSVGDIEMISDNITLITSYFFQNYPDQTKVESFVDKYSIWLGGGYLDILLTMKEFRDFNIFDYINITSNYNENMSENEKKDRKQMITIRNNIILSTIVVARELEECERNGEIDFEQSEPIFNDLRFLNYMVEKFKNIIIERDNVFNVDYDVELLFFALLGFKDKSRIIKQKFNYYFKNLEIDLGLNTANFNDFLNITVEKSKFYELSDEEILVYRRILNDAAKRDFYYGIEFLMRNQEFCFLLSEGRIWKNIGIKMEPFKVYNLWSMYEEHIEEIYKTDLRETLDLEYQEKLKCLNQKLAEFSNNIDARINNYDTYNKLIFDKKTLMKEIYLFCVNSLKDLMIVFFRYDLKELILYFFDEYKNTRGENKIGQDIYEIVLDYNEDIAIDILDRAISSSNAKEWYIKVKKKKKYFRLARRLLKFKVCKNCLITSVSNESNDYIEFLSKIQVNQKKLQFEKIKFQDNLEEIKIINFMKEKDSEESEDEKLKERLKETTVKRLIRERFQVRLNIKNTVVKASHNLLTKKILGDINEEIPNDNKISSVKDVENKYLFLKDNKNYLSDVSNDEITSVNRLITNKKNNLTQIKSNLKIKSITTHLENFRNSKTALNGNTNIPKIKIDYLDKNNKNEEKNFGSFFSFKSNFEDNGKINSKHTKQVLFSSKNNINYNKSNSQMSRQISDEMKFKEIKEGKFQINMQMLLIEQLRYGKYAFDVLCLLSSIPIKIIKPEYYDKICKYISIYTENLDEITKCLTPLITIALAAELLRKIGKANKKTKYKSESIIEEILILSENLQSSMKDEDMLNYYLRIQTDHNGRSALEIYAENGFYNVLSDLNVGIIVGKLWYGQGYEQSIHKFMRMTRILMANSFGEHYYPMVSNKYLPKDSVYAFQFHQYASNCSVRNFFESSSVLLITLLYQFVVYSYVTYTKENIIHPKNHYYHKCEILADILMSLSLVNYVLSLFYFYLTGRKLQINSIELVINIIMLITIIINLVDLVEIFFPAYENPDLNVTIDGIVYSLMLTMAWMKFIIKLMATKNYGPFVRIIFGIFWHVFAFFMIVICITFLFAQIFCLFFQHSNEDFDLFYDSFLALFNTAYGQVYFRFTDLDIFGEVLMILFSTLSNIILFNLIVAVVNNLFNNLQEQADAENRALLVLTHERIKWDERYGLLIFLPSPLNIFSLLFIPWLFIINDNKKIKANLIFSKICFFSIAIITYFYLIIVGILCFPFSLFKALFHSIYDTYVFYPGNKYRKIIFIIFTEPLNLLRYLVEDSFFYWTLVFKEPIENEQKKQEELMSLKKYINTLRKVLIDGKYKEKKKVLTIQELYSKLSLFKKRKKKKKNNSPNNQTMSTIPLKNFESTNGMGSILENNIKLKKEKESNSSSEKSFKINQKNEENNNTNKDIYNENNNINQFSIVDSTQNEKNQIQEEMKFNFRKIIDKIVDPEGFIDIDRTLSILPEQVKYSENIIHNLEYLSVRAMIRGVTKFEFLNAMDNPIYSFKKLQLLIFKLIIKFKIIYSILPDNILKTINEKFIKVNERKQYEKTPIILQKYEERDDISEYDDEEEYVREFESKEENNLNTTIKSYDNKSTYSHSNQEFISSNESK